MEKARRSVKDGRRSSQDRRRFQDRPYRGPERRGGSDRRILRQRRKQRIRKSIRGAIRYQGASYSCLLDDLSAHGMALVTGADVGVGERVIVDLHVPGDRRLICVVEVRHVHSDGIGGRIVDISKSHSVRLGEIVEKR